MSLLSQAKSLLDQSQWEQADATLFHIVRLQGVSPGMTEQESQLFGDMGRAITERSRAEQSNPTPQQLVLTTLAVDCQGVENRNRDYSPQKNDSDGAYYDAQTGKYDPSVPILQVPVQQGLEPCRQDFQGGV
jgi:hypothetical protein